MSDNINPTHVPQAVKDAFAKKFPGVTPSEWEMEAEYEVEFIQNDREVEVTFYPDGTIAQVEYEIDPEDLPQAVQQAVMQMYPHCDVIEAERVETGEGHIKYEVQLSFEVHMTPDGKLVAMGKDL